MAAGDHTRSWWPEMLSEIKNRWTPEYTWQECATLCKEMSSLRDNIRSANGIVAPIVKSPCPCCGGKMTIVPFEITVRSLLFALHKIGLIDSIELARMDKSWKRYQKEMSLNGCGDRKPKPKSSTDHELKELLSKSIA